MSPLLAQSGHLVPLSMRLFEPLRCMSGGQMRRREFIGIVGSVAATWPLAARAQQSTNVRRVGVLFAAYSEADRAGQARITAFTKSLDSLGWGESRIRIDYR